MAWTRRVGWLLLVLGALLLVVWGARAARTAQLLREHLAQVQALAEAPQSVDPAAACSLVRALRADVSAVQRDAGLLVRLGPALGWLPRVGGDLRAAPHLLVVADGLTEAGALACDALEPALVAFSGADAQAADPSPEWVLGLLAEERPSLERALDAIERAQAAWARVDVQALSPWVADRLAPLESALPLARSGLAAATLAPDLLGMDGPRTYLILALNEDERRPVGGYITGAGEVRFDAGRVVAMDFFDGTAVDDFTQPYPDAPEPLQRTMGIDLWLFRDSNWSPDFPTAARQAVTLYRPGHPVAVDGVIAADQQAVRGLVSALGALEVEGAEEPVTGETVIAYMRQAWEPEGEDFGMEWFLGRKSFMGALAEAAWTRVEAGQVDWLAVARATLRLLEEKHLLVYVPRPEVAALLAAEGWDGALRAGDGDFLMVVDANVGYNKASVRVQETIDYQVDLAASPPRAGLTLVYTHTSTADYPCLPEVRYDAVYEQMMDRCYWDYLRVFVPQGSQLLAATRIPIPGEAMLSGQGEPGEVTVRPVEEGPWLSLETVALLAPATTQTRSFTWTLPMNVVQWNGATGQYALWVQKQPGTLGHALTVRVRLPQGVALLEAQPEPALVDGQWVVFRTVLDRDRAFTLRFAR